MGQSHLNLSALIGSRICHDLISPVGAINNGLELLNMSGAVQGPELDLIGQSVGSATARIRFFRIAFGAAGEQSVGRAEVVSILRDLYSGGRLSVDWTPEEPQSRNITRMVFLAILCLETAMPYGGRIAIEVQDGHWKLRATADKISVDPDLWALLENPDQSDKLQPAHVQFVLLPMIASDIGRLVGSQLVTQPDETTLTIRL
tara:strand:+ start:2091 stop:2699 length:609 start_codon:yes stop_codon:yes gene_type:complete